MKTSKEEQGSSASLKNKQIEIRGAYLHNLKHIDLDLPKGELIVITGLSGSGKSSLAFDTLYAEGQRRYIETFSSYARQFLGKIDKPKVKSIKGLSPTIALEQKVISSNPRSTVGTTTEIYDYLKLLYSRIGKTYSPISQEEVIKNDIEDVISYIKGLPIDSKWLLMAPIGEPSWDDFQQELYSYQKQGYSRLKLDGHFLLVEEALDYKYKPKDRKNCFLVIERIIIEEDEAFYERLADSIQIAYNQGDGICLLEEVDKEEVKLFSRKFEKDGMTFLEPNIYLFSFNNPHGACFLCEGFGMTLAIDEDLVVPDKKESLYGGAIAPWHGMVSKQWQEKIIKEAHKVNFPIHRSYAELDEEEKKMLWEGTAFFEGIWSFFKKIEEKSYKVQNRVMLSRYRRKTICPECHGKRLRKEASWVKIAGRSIIDLIDLPLDELRCFIKELPLKAYEKEISSRIIVEILSRLDFLIAMGIDYLSLNRASNSLSGGESQRVYLANALGSSLIGSIYVLDEPSMGLHPVDTMKLIAILKKLRDLGNTVIVIEHDSEIISSSDYLVDIGPKAGYNGGNVSFSGRYNALKQSNTLTAQYLNGVKKVGLIGVKERKVEKIITLKGAKAHNLKNLSVDIPLHMLTFVTGVSGSGKSTLIREVLYEALLCHLEKKSHNFKLYDDLSGDLEGINKVEMIHQNLVGKSSRSNPATYSKAYDEIRSLFTKQPLSKRMGLKSKDFSFNMEGGGRCEKCKGEGEITIEMQFMADVKLTCEECQGLRFKKDILEVELKGKNIAQLLDMSIEEAILFFKGLKQEKIVQKLNPLEQVGLGYLKLGQPSSTLSGGEIQRMKLASFLSKGSHSGGTLFIFDEPTRGLHLDDINHLLYALNALVEKGHSLIVIEHNVELIASADWIIDLGPGGGKKGGEIITQGSPSLIAKHPYSHIGKFLKKNLELQN